MCDNTPGACLTNDYFKIATASCIAVLHVTRDIIGGRRNGSSITSLTADRLSMYTANNVATAHAPHLTMTDFARIQVLQPISESNQGVLTVVHFAQCHQILSSE